MQRGNILVLPPTLPSSIVATPAGADAPTLKIAGVGPPPSPVAASMVTENWIDVPASETVIFSLPLL